MTSSAIGAVRSKQTVSQLLTVLSVAQLLCWAAALSRELPAHFSVSFTVPSVIGPIA